MILLNGPYEKRGESNLLEATLGHIAYLRRDGVQAVEGRSQSKPVIARQSGRRRRQILPNCGDNIGREQRFRNLIDCGENADCREQALFCFPKPGVLPFASVLAFPYLVVDQPSRFVHHEQLEKHS